MCVNAWVRERTCVAREVDENECGMSTCFQVVLQCLQATLPLLTLWRCLRMLWFHIVLNAREDITAEQYSAGIAGAHTL